MRAGKHHEGRAGEDQRRVETLQNLVDHRTVERERAAEIAHQAIVTAPSAQFADIAENDPMTVRGRPFRVRFWKDDGTGVIEIYLEAGD